MTDSRPSHGTDDLVEGMGVWFAALGVPRTAGQMFGYLLACDPPEQSAGEISRNTGISPASVSASARLLVQIAAVEPRHRLGDRKTYYRLRSDFWMGVAQAKLQGFGQLAVLGRNLKASGRLTRTDGVDEMIAFSDFWADELPRMAGRWERFRNGKREG